MESTLITVRTGGKPAVVDITGRAEFVRDKGRRPAARLRPARDRRGGHHRDRRGQRRRPARRARDAVPADNRWRHRHGSPGHGRDHVLPAFVAPYATLPVLDGRLALGTWQSLCLVDTNGDNPTRQVGSRSSLHDPVHRGQPRHHDFRRRRARRLCQCVARRLVRAGAGRAIVLWHQGKTRVVATEADRPRALARAGVHPPLPRGRRAALARTSGNRDRRCRPELGPHPRGHRRRRRHPGRVGPPPTGGCSRAATSTSAVRGTT